MRVLIEIDGWEYLAWKEYGQWWCDPLDPDAPELDDKGVIEDAVADTQRQEAALDAAERRYLEE